MFLEKSSLMYVLVFQWMSSSVLMDLNFPFFLVICVYYYCDFLCLSFKVYEQVSLRMKFLGHPGLHMLKFVKH